ncbi:MAG TPA: M17 family metallopeptidase, partial [Candidatus Dormibacteraeota bacterium]|nr:M17 family metallopeptidase [Candidatus Dormibacteraeota bacterium]
LPVEAIGILCIAENQLGGRAMRPGDVIRTGLGKTIEVVNTDAEGRLVLADGLHHAATLGATHIVDIATLTGAQRVALGPVAAAYVADDEMAARLEPAAAAAGERVWRMPAFPEYETMVESPVADLANSTGRDAGIIGAALLIRAFAHGLPWAHLDIAAPANSFNSRLSQLPKGPTGFGVRTLYRLCQAMAAADAGAPAAATRRKSDSISRK